MASSDKDTPAAKKSSVFHRLYVGTGAFDIVGKRKRWYLVFAALVIVSIAAIGVRGFNFGIEFVGGTQIQMPAQGAHGTITAEEAGRVFADSLGKQASSVQTVGVGNAATVQIRSESLPQTDVSKVEQDLFAQLQPLGANGQPSVQAISDSAVSASWGGEISRQALIALGVFMVLVTIFLTIYFERWMALAALVSLLHDIVVTAGVYALVGFEVNPATVIGLLTILGFSLYDTVVVFDKVKENTRGLLGLTRRTFGEAANLALNQTLMRSINTSIIALLPVLGLLIVGYILLGSGVLQDLALVQLTGMLAGVLSSLFLATPVLVDFKMRDPKYKQQAERVRSRRANLARKAAEREAAEDDFDASDDDALAAELRKEKAYAAAASVPARTPKGTRPQPRKGRPSGKRRR
ncbi:protein translocase subunit SecF [Amycolatopsis alkalitolerans]|uniref:Protein-export membrane protein SecF n=1 Tax=Amycolatopsis alkalitolerans TaxID=2547244 RepID=A0A5C4M6K6_9PSEU|nr:protein translocase subunit SecF [Amycolatopsis alkalitolerans]TNC26427.1 protein translocase subunit SecF [Amycolatopsis alkalitolerans]